METLSYTVSREQIYLRVCSCVLEDTTHSPCELVINGKAMSSRE
jgi:hypothetical protein